VSTPTGAGAGHWEAGRHDSKVLAIPKNLLSINSWLSVGRLLMELTMDASNRRQFFERIGAGTRCCFSPAAAGAMGYGGSSAPAPAQNQCGAGTITGNHGHSFGHSRGDLDSMGTRPYNTKAPPPQPHASR